MKLFALFALLPLLANAAPLNLGGLLPAPAACQGSGCTWPASNPTATTPAGAVPPKVATGSGLNVGAGVVAGVGAGLNIGNPIPAVTAPQLPNVGSPPAALPAVPNAISNIPKIVDSAPNNFPAVPVVPVIANAVPAIVAEVPSVVEPLVADISTVLATAPTVIASVPKVLDNLAHPAALPAINVPIVNLPTVAVPTAAGPAPTAHTPSPNTPAINIGGIVNAALDLGTPSKVLDDLASSISGLNAPSSAVAIVQLNAMIGSLSAACGQQANALKGRIDLAHIVAYVMALIRNISIYLNRLPSNILTNGTVKSCAGSIDDLVASYIYGLQVIGLSTSAFVDLALKQGLTAHDFSPLLPKTCAIFPSA